MEEYSLRAEPTHRAQTSFDDDESDLRKTLRDAEAHEIPTYLQKDRKTQIIRKRQERRKKKERVREKASPWCASSIVVSPSVYTQA